MNPPSLFDNNGLRREFPNIYPRSNEPYDPRLDPYIGSSTTAHTWRQFQAGPNLPSFSPFNLRGDLFFI